MQPPAFRIVSRLVHGPLPQDRRLGITQLGLAAWFGLFVTALSLVPVGQLDGGHVTWPLLRERSRLVSRIGS